MLVALICSRTDAAVEPLLLQGCVWVLHLPELEMNL